MLNIANVKAHQRIGTYWHMLPEAAQARKAVWDAIDKQGRRVRDQAFPPQLVKAKHEQDMKIELHCGSFIQLVGSDNYNSLVGSNPIGVTFSEYAIAKPAAWDYIRPILLENGGWASFIFTPRGKNHGKKIWDIASKNPDWFHEILTVNDTMLLTPEQIEQERADGMSDEMVEQEYFCSWEGAVVGSIYADQIRKARAEGRITQVPYDRRYPVHTFWDIGHGDTTAICCYQQVGMQDRWINGFEDYGQDVPHYVQWLRETGYTFGKHHLPHDAKNVTLASANRPEGEHVWGQLVSAGISEADLVLVPRTQNLWASINATRARWGTCYFDEEKCEGLLNALGEYHKVYDEDRQAYLDKPYHNWASNYSDAFRQWAQGYNPDAGVRTFTAPRVMANRLPSGGRIVTVGNRRTGY